MANTLSVTDTEQIWRIAIPLSSAHLLTATEDETKRFRELSRMGGSYAMFTQADPAQLQSFKDIANSNGFKISTEFTALHTTLSQRLKQQLFSGELIGLGYAQPRQPNALPQLIPPDIWSGHLRPNKEEVSHAGLQYLGVRVVTHKKVLASTPLSTNGPKVDIKQLGRPSLRPYILQAYGALKADGKIDFNNSLKAHVPIISWWVSTHCPNAMTDKTGIDYTTIQKAIGNQFKNKS